MRSKGRIALGFLVLLEPSKGSPHTTIISVFECLEDYSISILLSLPITYFVHKFYAILRNLMVLVLTFVHTHSTINPKNNCTKVHKFLWIP